jgi:hypothetical protein
MYVGCGVGILQENPYNVNPTPLERPHELRTEEGTHVEIDTINVCMMRVFQYTLYAWEASNEQWKVEPFSRS